MFQASSHPAHPTESNTSSTSVNSPGSMPTSAAQTSTGGQPICRNPLGSLGPWPRGRRGVGWCRVRSGRLGLGPRADEVGGRSERRLWGWCFFGVASFPPATVNDSHQARHHPQSLITCDWHQKDLPGVRPLITLCGLEVCRIGSEKSFGLRLSGFLLDRRIQESRVELSKT